MMKTSWVDISALIAMLFYAKYADPNSLFLRNEILIHIGLNIA